MAEPALKAIRAYEESTISIVVDNTAKQRSSISSVRRRSPRWERYRCLDQLKPCQIGDMHEANKFAAEIGLPLNRFISINWLLTEVGHLNSDAFAHGMKNMGQWFRDSGYSTAWIYVHECPSKEGKECPNSHILLHLPRRVIRAKFDEMLRIWFSASNGGTVSEPRMKPGQWRDTRLQYMSKGAHHLVCRGYGGYRKKGGQGIVTFKRSGTSQNIGKAARKARSIPGKAA